MVNSINMADGYSCKINGKVHNRKDELTTYRQAIYNANIKMTEAADNGNLELAQFWSSIIDSAQEKIFAIINQEDNHNSSRTNQFVDVANQAVDIGEKIIDTGSKLAVFA